MIKDKKTLRKLDVIFGIVLLLCSIAVLYESAMMPISGLGGAMQSSFWIAPGALPVVVSSILIILSMVLIVGALKEEARIGMGDVRKAAALLGTAKAKYILIMAGLLIVYIFFMIGNLPYLLSTFIFLSAFMFIFKGGKAHVILLTAAATTFAIWYCFGQFVLIPLP